MTCSEGSEPNWSAAWLALAGYGFAPTAARGRLWTLSLLAAIVLICAFGVVLAVTHHTFAVS